MSLRSQFVEVGIQQGLRTASGCCVSAVSLVQNSTPTHPFKMSFICWRNQIISCIMSHILNLADGFIVVPFNLFPYSLIESLTEFRWVFLSKNKKGAVHFSGVADHQDTLTTGPTPTEINSYSVDTVGTAWFLYRKFSSGHLGESLS
jgi:hypothetical protein